MQAEINGTKVTFDVFDALHYLDAPAQKMRLVNTLACDEQIIEEVANLIIDGMTSDGSGSYGRYPYGADYPNAGPLQRAADRIIAARDDIAARRHRAVLAALRETHASLEKLRKEYFELRHGHTDRYGRF